MLKIKIDIDPMPLNRAYSTSRQGRRFLVKEGSDYKKIVAIKTKEALKDQPFRFNDELQYLTTEFFFYSPKLFTKQRKINRKKPDTSNCIKLLEDAIFETLKIDDCYNLDINAHYNYSESPMIVVIIRAHNLIDKSEPLNNLTR